MAACRFSRSDKGEGSQQRKAVHKAPVPRDRAKKSLPQHHGDLTIRKHLLGFFEIRVGIFHWQKFRWVAENALGYAAYLVAAMKRDPTGGSKDTQGHAHNKVSFREYIELFPSGRVAIAMNEEQYAGKAPQHAATTQHAAPTQFTAPTHQPRCLYPACCPYPACFLNPAHYHPSYFHRLSAPSWFGSFLTRETMPKQ
ncbi:hypothetical protein E1301_Tti022816 [Triplophysa tibetana]|uniref:Uncharacterized protein n=1 Tax=Triplophysa tibetana TaxID=1572043 RepID=A0A5A9MZ73_9TELE|nr:hypothetical protein E1301_Tti022816 [Triplophysa tibetana]